MATGTQPEEVNYVLHDNGVHEIIIHNTSRPAADAFIAHVDRIFSDLPDDAKVVRMIFHSKHSGMLPVIYLMPRLRELLGKHRNRPATRTAFVRESGVFINMLDTFIRMVRNSNDTVRYFHTSQYDEAVEWLFADR